MTETGLDYGGPPPAPTPIFILWTRSFWLGILPALLTALDVLFIVFADPGTAGPAASMIAMLVNLILPGDPVAADGVQTFLIGAAPFYALFVAHQRRGENRPYTTKVRPETIR